MTYNQKIVLLFLCTTLILSACTATIQYQCIDGSFVNNPEQCAEATCPEAECPDLDCSSCPVETQTRTVEKEITKYQCYDGSIKSKLSDCTDIQEIRRTTFDLDEAREQTRNFISEDYSNEDMTKFTLSGDTLVIEFSHSNWVADILRKSVFSLVKLEAGYLTDRDKEVDLDITATTPMGGHLTCITTWDDLVQISNLEMGYEDWKLSARCSQSDLY